MAITSNGGTRQQILSLFQQAGFPVPSEAAIQYYLSKGPAGVPLLTRNLQADKRSKLYKAPSTPNGEVQSLVDAMTPKQVDEAVLSGRFSSLFDQTFQQNEKDINSELDTSASRFAEDAAVADQRRAQARAQALGQSSEALAAGGASGMLADYQKLQAVQPYDQASADAAVQSSRFATDTAEQRRKRILANQQARATARASYLADPNNKYEFSY